MHNANKEIRNEFTSHLCESRRYRKRANSCDALETQSQTQGSSQHQTSPLKPVRPAPSTPDAKVTPSSNRPVPAPRVVTPRLGTTPQGKGAGDLVVNYYRWMSFKRLRGQSYLMSCS